MDISEAQEAKSKLERDIKGLVQDFQAKTHTRVMEIMLRSDEIYAAGGRVILFDVLTKVDL
jgi:Trp operon repressor